MLEHMNENCDAWHQFAAEPLWSRPGLDPGAVDGCASIATRSEWIEPFVRPGSPSPRCPMVSTT